MCKKLLVVFAALLSLLCSCQRAVQRGASVAPAISTTQPPAHAAQSTTAQVAWSIPTPEAFDDIPALLSNGGDSDGFIVYNIDEFEMLMIDRADVRQKFGIPLFYYMPTYIPEGFSFQSASCGSHGINVNFAGPSVRWEGETIYTFRTSNIKYADFLEDIDYRLDQDFAELVVYNGISYYVDNLICVSPNDDDDKSGIKPQNVDITWYDDALGKSFYVSIPNLTAFDPSLLRYCEFEAVVIDPERIDGLRPELLKNYSHEFPVDPERIAAEADFSAPDRDAFIEMYQQRADIREAYKYTLTKYNPIWNPPGYELESVCCGRLGIAFLYRKGTSSILFMAYNRYRNDFLRQLQQYVNEGRMERHELEILEGYCYVMASETGGGIDIYRYDEYWEQAIYVHIPVHEYDPSMLDQYCMFSMVEIE